MKAPFSTLLLTLALIANSVASGPAIIEILSTGAGVSYHLENTNARTEKDAKTLNEVEEWTRGVLKGSPEELFMICPDKSTTFKTVSDLLRRLKAAGCGQFAVVTIDSGSGGTTVHSLVGRTDKNITETDSSSPAEKKEP
jgi:hypothetical protein